MHLILLIPTISIFYFVKMVTRQRKQKNPTIFKCLIFINKFEKGDNRDDV